MLPGRWITSTCLCSLAWNWFLLNYIPFQTVNFLHIVRSWLEEIVTIVVQETNCTARSLYFAKHWTSSLPRSHIPLLSSEFTPLGSASHDPWITKYFLNSSKFPPPKKASWKQTSSKKSSQVQQPAVFLVYLNHDLSFIFFVPSLKRNCILGLAIKRKPHYI